jgi:hypothetical protein
MLFQTGQAAAGAPFAESEYVDFSAQITLAAGDSLLTGQVVCRDVTQVVGVAGQVGTSATSSLPDVVVFPSNANAGRTYGVYQGPTVANSSSAAITFVTTFRRKGIGVVLATGVSGGTAVTVGATLVAQPASSDEVIVGSFATGKLVGMAVATAINTQLRAAVAGAAGVVAYALNPVGITTSTPLVIDTAQSGVQETVTPSAITQGVPASTTLTVTVVSANVGSVFTITLGGSVNGVPVSVTVTYTSVSGDTTATALAGHLVTAINAAIAASPAGQFFVAATNSAGVITITAANSGTAGNSLNTTASISTGTTNYTISPTATTNFSSGTNTSFTATFVNAHAANAPITGAATASGATLVALPASGAANGLVTCDIDI